MKKLITSLLSVSLVSLMVGSTFACHADCDGPAGIYRVIYTTMSGNCGDIPPYEGEANQPIGPAAGCTMNTHLSADRCSGSVEFQCSSGTHLLLTADSSGDGKSINGMMEITNGNNGCSGTYDYSETFLHN